MKRLIGLVILATLLGCAENKNPLSVKPDRITLKTNRSFYNRQDTIHFTLKNSTDSSITLELLCRSILEIACQEFKNGEWGKIKYFVYPLKCPVFFEELKPGDERSDFLMADKFKSSGRFRLVYSYMVGRGTNRIAVYSNDFEITR